MHHGDAPGLLRRKPYFRADVEKGALGSPPLMGLLRNLKPHWWFAAHLHCRFEATVVHEVPAPTQNAGPGAASAGKINPDEIDIGDEDEEDADASGPNADAGTQSTETAPAPAPPPRQNPEEITLDDEEDDVEAPPPPPPPPAPVSETRFLALDKCLPKRQFLEVRVVSSVSFLPLSWATCVRELARELQDAPIEDEQRIPWQVLAETRRCSLGFRASDTRDRLAHFRAPQRCVWAEGTNTVLASSAPASGL